MIELYDQVFTPLEALKNPQPLGRRKKDGSCRGAINFVGPTEQGRTTKEEELEGAWVPLDYQIVCFEGKPNQSSVFYYIMTKMKIIFFKNDRK